jgi:hypothetical protein
MAVIRLDKIAGIHLESIKAPEVLKNGYFLQLGALVSGETELRTATKPTDVTKPNLVLHATPEVMADARKTGLKHFQIEQGDEARAYRLVVGDIITLTQDLFASLPVVGEDVAPQNGSFLLETALGTESLILDVIQETTLGYDNDKAFVCQVIKA